MRSKALKHPGRLLRRFDQSICDDLGVTPGQVWSYQDYTRKIGFHKMRGMYRMHAVLGHVLKALKNDQKGDATVLVVQMMKALHQVYLDGGDWRSAVLYLPVPDPLARKEFGGAEEEIEVIATYWKAMVELQKAHQWQNSGGGNWQQDQQQQQQVWDEEQPQERKKSWKGRGKGKELKGGQQEQQPQQAAAQPPQK